MTAEPVLLDLVSLRGRREMFYVVKNELSVPYICSIYFEILEMIYTFSFSFFLLFPKVY